MAVRRFPDLTGVAKAMADELPAIVKSAIESPLAECHLVLSGGSTPKALFKELLARGREFLPWDSIHLWWGDERCVPRDHPESNFGMAYTQLIEPLGIDASLVHRMRGEELPADAAKAYEEHIYNSFGDNPVFTLQLLGMGPDGHTASLFPGQPIDPDRIVITTLAPNGHSRITMTPKLINASTHRRFLVAGAEKSDVLAKVIDGTGNYPAQLIQNADWLVDEAAAKGLT